jgi:nitrite reductase (NADH) large subunit
MPDGSQGYRKPGERPKLVVVGNGMAGMRTVEELLKLRPELYDITVFGAEPHPNYNRILLSPVLAGEQQVADIILNPLDWYRENGITLHTGRKVTRIDRKARVVEAEDGSCCRSPAPNSRAFSPIATSPTPKP